MKRLVYISFLLIACSPVNNSEEILYSEYQGECISYLRTIHSIDVDRCNGVFQYTIDGTTYSFSKKIPIMPYDFPCPIRYNINNPKSIKVDTYSTLEYGGFHVSYMENSSGLAIYFEK